MCVSIAPARFSATTLYAGRRTHPVLGPIEVLGYQNKAVNLARKPNAMVLHIPANLTRNNFLWVSEQNSGILDQMVEVLKPPSYGGYGAAPGAAQPATPAVQVFDHDIYTIVLAEDPTQIPAALQQVPPNKRPLLDRGLFDFYAAMYPYHSIVLCCFDNAEAHRANPLLIWYPPPFDDWIIMPAVDGHTGGVPDLAAQVDTDHWLVFGADNAPEGIGRPVYYHEMDPVLRAFLPDRVVGREYRSQTVNGDFALSIQNLHHDYMSGIERVQPVAYRA